MVQRIWNFVGEENGAVTVDWVVLTAAIVGMGVLVITSVANGATDMATGVGGHLNTATVTTTY